MGLFAKVAEAAKDQVKAQVEQAKADALAKVEQAKADALATVEQAKANTLGKVEQVKADAQLTREDPAAALHEYRDRKAAREAKRQAKAEAKAAAAEARARAEVARARAERAERIAKATGPDGKIRANGVAWDGQALLLEGRAVKEIMKETKIVTRTQGRVDGSGFAWGESGRFTTYGGVQRGRSVSQTSQVDVARPLKKGQIVLIPAEDLRGADYKKGQVLVFVADGREYTFSAPEALVEAIEARTEEVLVE